MKEVLKFVQDLIFGDAKQRFNAAKYVSDYVAMITRAITVLVIYSFWMKLGAAERPLPTGYMRAADQFIQYSLFGYAGILMLGTGSIAFGIIDRAGKERYEGKNPVLRHLFPLGQFLVRTLIFLMFVISFLMIIIGFYQARAL
ncbi:hypothetical protein [Rhizobium leguminosarum]|uniref:hypothetical protein n=1 Tax=Rhizobium leguminosarum TaxID=384 RepID=UPI00140F5E0C|nr:hypothetical protein [Rhizobium leguminosarum]QIO64754.1 hypothetical protein HA462_06725 [Rhizobium leguminosarum bv. trifolii]